jgi:hypothetical protein
MRRVKGFINVNNRMELTEYSGQVMNMTISLDELGLTNPECAGEFAQRCAFTKSMTVRISTDTLWSCDDHSERAYDWLAVLMFGEFLAGLETRPTYEIVHGGENIMAVDFTIHENITASTLTSIMQYGAALLAFQTEGTATCHFAATDIMDYEAEFLVFQEDVQNRVTVFHDLAARYAEAFISGQQNDNEAPNEYTDVLMQWLDVVRVQRASA